MTGKQLQYEFELSGQTAQKFSEGLGIGRTKLYAQFKMPIVEGAIVIAFNKLKISDKVYEISQLAADHSNKNVQPADLPNNPGWFFKWIRKQSVYR